MTAASIKTGRLNAFSENRQGFTLIELMIVMTIIGILVAVAAPNYQWALIRAREAVLRENLYSIRSAIDQFYADQGKYPETLADLVNKRYLHTIPRDPFTSKDNTWIIITPPADTPVGMFQGTSLSTAQSLVYDLQSGSNLIGSDGRPYREW